MSNALSRIEGVFNSIKPESSDRPRTASDVMYFDRHLHRSFHFFPPLSTLIKQFNHGRFAPYMHHDPVQRVIFGNF